MGTYVRCYDGGEVALGHDTNYDRPVGDGEIIGAHSDRYEIDDRIKFDPDTLWEMKEWMVPVAQDLHDSDAKILVDDRGFCVECIKADIGDVEEYVADNDGVQIAERTKTIDGFDMVILEAANGGDADGE